MRGGVGLAILGASRTEGKIRINVRKNMLKWILRLLVVVSIIAIGSGYDSCYQNGAFYCMVCDTPPCLYCPGHWGCTSIDPNANELIYEVFSPASVSKNPTMPSTFKLDTTRTITAISTYHWPGYTPGTIGLRSNSGTMYGPWQASACHGMGGVANAYWVVYPNIQLPPGTYSIVDSGQSSWAYVPSDCTGARGICMVFAAGLSNPGSLQAPGSLPGSLHECETYTTEICGTWTWEGDHYNAKWNQGTLGTVKVERWGTSGVVLTRNDYAGENAGTVGHYEGQLSGNTIKNGVYTVTYEGNTVSGTWYANW